MASIDPFTTQTAIIALSIVLLSLVGIYLRLPQILVYIFAGIVLGPYVLNLINNLDFISLLGTIGVMFLLFFIGMEMSIKRLVANWKIAIGGGLLEVIFGLIVIGIIGSFLDWPLGRIVTISFVVTLSSTAVILKLLEETGELNRRLGQNVTSILIMEDVMIVPMLLFIGFMSGDSITASTIIPQIIGAVLIIGLVSYVFVKEKISIPLIKKFKDNQEIEVFLALSLCFGFAFITGALGLSTALGAFIAGLIISCTEEKRWIEKHLHSLYIIFVALFFISIGILVDIPFFIAHWKIVLLLVVVAFIINIIVNTFALRLLGLKWREAVYSSVILAQIGEFSFVLASAGLQTGFIDSIGYNYAISIISVSLILTPFIISISRKLLGMDVHLKTPISSE